MDNFKEDYSNIESVSTPPMPPTPQEVGCKEKKANAKAEKADMKAQQAASKAQKKEEKKAAQAQRPFYKKWWFWIIVILLCLGIFNPNKKNSNNNIQRNEVEKEENVPEEYKEALSKAKEFYSQKSWLSKQGLYEELTGIGRGNFSSEAAQYAIDHFDGDFDKQALKWATHLAKENLSKAVIYDSLMQADFTDGEVEYAMKNLKADFNKNARGAAWTYYRGLATTKEEIYKILTEEKLFTPEEAQYAIDHLD